MKQGLMVMLFVLWTGIGQGMEPSQITAVYERVGAAAGLFTELPVLKVDPSSSHSRAAYFDPTKPRTEIVIEEKALEVCRSFGNNATNALAILLGHELAHYTLGVNWGSDFKAYSDHRKINDDVDFFNAYGNVRGIFELQADQKGTFYAFLAGYSPELVADSLFPRLYKAYNWNQELNGYPSLADRQKILASGLQRSAELTYVQRMANLLLAMDRPEEALWNYELLLTEGFRNPKLLNNMAICHLRIVAARHPHHEKAPLLPFELSLKTVWRSGSSSVDRNEHFFKARKALLQALAMDPQDKQTNTNLACLALMEEDVNEAAYVMEKPGVHYDPESIALLEGYIYYLRNDRERAIEIYAGRALAGSSIARTNMEILTGVNPTFDEGPRMNFIPGEQLLGKDLITLTSLNSSLRPVHFRGEELLWKADEGTIWQMRCRAHLPENGPDVIFYFAGTGPVYQGKTSRGKTIGTPRIEVLAGHTTDVRSISTDQGSLEIVTQEGIAYSFDHEGILSGWILFAEISDR